jgi:hypothetical protein
MNQHEHFGDQLESPFRFFEMMECSANDIILNDYHLINSLPILLFVVDVNCIAFLVMKSFLHCYDTMNWPIHHLFVLAQFAIHFSLVINWNHWWISKMLMSIQTWSDPNKFAPYDGLKLRWFGQIRCYRRLLPFRVVFMWPVALFTVECWLSIVNPLAIFFHDYFVGLVRDLVWINPDFSVYLDFLFNHLKKRSKSSWFAHFSSDFQIMFFLSFVYGNIIHYSWYPTWVALSMIWRWQRELLSFPVQISMIELFKSSKVV